MAIIGWTTDVYADTYFATHIQFDELWAGLTVEKRVAALTTSYNKILYSKEVAIPASPTSAILEKLQYAQLEYAGLLAIPGEGAARRVAAIAQGVKSAGIVKETYDLSKAGKLPQNILDILDDLKTEKVIYLVDIFRDETDNSTFDRNYNGYTS